MLPGLTSAGAEPADPFCRANSPIGASRRTRNAEKNVFFISCNAKSTLEIEEVGKFDDQNPLDALAGSALVRSVGNIRALVEEPSAQTTCCRSSLESLIRAELRTNSFVSMIRQKDGNISIQDFGDAERLLRNRQYFQRKAQLLISRGVVPTETNLGGWLGKYESALAHGIAAIQDGEQKLINREVPRERER